MRISTEKRTPAAAAAVGKDQEEEKDFEEERG